MEYIDRRSINKKILHINTELHNKDSKHKKLSMRMINNIPLKKALEIIEIYNNTKSIVDLDEHLDDNCLKNKSLSLKQLQKLLHTTDIHNSNDKLFLCRTLIDYGYTFKDNKYIIDKYNKESTCNKLSKAKCLKNVNCIYNTTEATCNNRITMSLPYDQLIKLYGFTILLDNSEFKIDNKDINFAKFNIINKEIHIDFFDTFKYSFIKFIYANIDIKETEILIKLQLYKTKPLIIYNIKSDEKVVGLENIEGYNPLYNEYLDSIKKHKEKYIEKKRKLKKMIKIKSNQISNIFGE